MEKKNITTQFRKKVSEYVPDIKPLLSKVQVITQDRLVFIRVLGDSTLEELEKNEEQITKAVSEIVPSPEVIFVPVQKGSPEAKAFERERQTYTFNNFIVSDTNRAAFNAMRYAAEQPTFEPIVIFGPPSVGKTHLLKALQYKVKKDGKYNIILLNMKKIVNDIFYHIQKKTFEQYYRDLTSYDYLLIDDLQKAGEMTSGKGIDKIDSFLFDVYEDFFEKDSKQLVFTCDRSPMALPFSDRVRSRLFSGSAYQIEPPDEPLKRVFLERLLVKYEPLTLPDDIKEIIVKNTINFRQIKEITQTAIEKYSLTGDKEYVANLVIVSAKTMDKKRLLLTPEEVIDAVCRLTGLKKDKVITDKTVRNKRALHAIYIIAYILTRELNCTYEETASALHKKSAITVNKYLKKVEALRIDDMDFRREMDDIVATILGK